MSHPGLMLGIEKKGGQNVRASHQNLLVGAHKIAIMAFVHQSMIIVEVVFFFILICFSSDTDHMMTMLQPDRWMQWLVHFYVCTRMAVTNEINEI